MDGDYARALGTQGAADLARGSLADSEILIRELESADCLVIGTPMHNYTVPSALKAWIDHVVRANRTFTHIPTGKLGVLADRRYMSRCRPADPSRPSPRASPTSSRRT